MNEENMSLEELRCELLPIATGYLPDEASVIPESYTVDFTIYEGIKKAYDYYAPRKSVSSHVPEVQNKTYDSNEANQHRMRRTHQELQRYRQNLHDKILEERCEDIPELATQSMRETKAAGYQVNDMQFYEIENYSNLLILKKIVHKQICDRRKVPIEMFRNLMADYEEEIARLRDGMNDAASILFNTEALFNLEWLFNIDIIYEIAKYGEIMGVKNIDTRHLVDIIGVRNPSTRRGGFHTQNRMLNFRRKLLPAVFLGQTELIHSAYESHLGLNQWLYNIYGRPLHEIVKERPVEEQAQFVKKHFWIWDERPSQKDWTEKRILIARDIYNDIIRTEDMPREPFGMNLKRLVIEHLFFPESPEALDELFKNNP